MSIAPKKNSITGEMDMAKCNECGKKGIFLKVNARGYCKDCQPICAASLMGENTLAQDKCELVVMPGMMYR